MINKLDLNSYHFEEKFVALSDKIGEIIDVLNQQEKCPICKGKGYLKSPQMGEGWTTPCECKLKTDQQGKGEQDKRILGLIDDVRSRVSSPEQEEILSSFEERFDKKFGCDGSCVRDNGIVYFRDHNDEERDDKLYTEVKAFIKSELDKRDVEWRERIVKALNTPIEVVPGTTTHLKQVNVNSLYDLLRSKTE